MSIEALLFTALAPLVGERVFPDVAPQDAPFPRIVYQQAGGEGLVFENGTFPDHENCRMQITTWGTQRLAVTALAKQVEAAIVGVPEFMAEPLGNRTSVYEPETKRYGARQDFSIWVPR